MIYDSIKIMGEIYSFTYEFYVIVWKFLCMTQIVFFLRPFLAVSKKVF